MKILWVFRPKNRAAIKPPSVYLIVATLTVVVVVSGYLALNSIKRPPTIPTTPTNEPQTESTADKTVNWQIYQNEKYGLEFKYPTEARLFLGADCLGCSDEELEAVNSARVIIDYSGGIIFQVQILEYNKTQPQFVKIGKNAEQTAELWRKYNKEGENNPNVFTYVSRIVEQNTNGLGGYSYTVSGSINFPWEMGLLSYPMRFNFFDFPARPETIIVISLSIREENLNDVSNQIISTFKFFEPTEK